GPRGDCESRGTVASAEKNLTRSWVKGPGFMVLDEKGGKGVNPRGGGRKPASVAMLVAAPGLFSTMNGWPSRSDSHCPIKRAAMSVGPPGANPTRICTGREG